MCLCVYIDIFYPEFNFAVVISSCSEKCVSRLPSVSAGGGRLIRFVTNLFPPLVVLRRMSASGEAFPSRRPSQPPASPHCMETSFRSVCSCCTSSGGAVDAHEKKTPLRAELTPQPSFGPPKDPPATPVRTGHSLGSLIENVCARHL